MNELHIGSTPTHKAQQGSYSSGTKPANDALPPKALQSASSGKELPPSSSSKEISGRAQIVSTVQAKDSDTRIAEFRKPEPKQTEKVLEDLNKAAVSLERNLNFKVDDETGRSIITVTDSVTNKVIRQIPSEEIVELAKNLQSLVQKAEVGLGNAPTGSSTGSLLNITA